MLFPGHPKLVRFRKLQALYFAIFLCVVACVGVGLLIYLTSRMGAK